MVDFRRYVQQHIWSNHRSRQRCPGAICCNTFRDWWPSRAWLRMGFSQRSPRRKAGQELIIGCSRIHGPAPTSITSAPSCGVDVLFQEGKGVVTFCLLVKTDAMGISRSPEHRSLISEHRAPHITFERAYASALGAWSRADRLKARPAHPAGPAALVSVGWLGQNAPETPLNPSILRHPLWGNSIGNQVAGRISLEPART